jgi:hypothetical protein
MHDLDLVHESAESQTWMTSVFPLSTLIDYGCDMHAFMAAVIDYKLNIVESLSNTLFGAQESITVGNCR